MRLRLSLLFLLLIVLLWSAVFFELARNRQETLHEEETAVQLQAQIYAENLHSTIKRLDELLLDLRSDWSGDWSRFSTLVRARRENIRDIAFQVAVIDADGRLAYSNLAPATDRTDLSDREHFRVHRDHPGDRLFISKPLQGRVSGKWTVQFTRAIRVHERFAGVIVVSISPEAFSTLHERFGLGAGGASSVVSDRGDLMARQPGLEHYLGRRLEVNWPSAYRGAPETGFYYDVSQIDKTERLFGYQKLSAYGLTCFVAEATDDVLVPHRRYARKLYLYAAIVSLILAAIGLLLLRALVARERVARLLQASQQQQRLLSLAVEQSNAAVMMVDPDGTIRFVNDAFERTSGYTRAEVIGANPRILKSGAHPPETYALLWQTISAGQPWHGVLQNRRKSGELYWESLNIAPVSADDGSIISYLAVKEDISERKRHEVELLLAKEEAEAASLAKSQFLATMSHEIRTPMNGILGMAQMLLAPGSSEAEREEYARTILNSGKTLQALLNDILDLSRVEAGKMELVPVPTDAVAMLRETVALFGESARQKGIELRQSWLAGAGCYRVDGVRLRQMLTNLLSNAIKFTDRGSIVVEGGEIVRENSSASLRFSVTDTGVGIPADKQGQLFQAFTQVDSSDTRRYTGSGLGLSIVRRLAELMHGEVGVDSEAGRGSCFWFTVRVDVLAACPGAKAEAADRVAVLASARAVRDIFLVEDNRVNQAVVRAMLGKLGYSVRCFDDGSKVLAAVEAGEVADLILMDCQMPEMDGFEATRLIRQFEAQRGSERIPIIALTAGAFEEDRQRCLDAGMDDFLTKPVERERLLAAINALSA